MLCLFIGGIRDGEWIDVVDSQPIVRVALKMVPTLEIEPRRASGSFIPMDYRRESFREGNDVFDVFVPVTWRGSVLHKLLRGYKP